MPENTTSGFENRIRTECPHLSTSQVKRAAKRIKHVMDNMSEVVDFYQGLRILGLLSDPTARDAVRNLENEQVAA